MTQLTRVIPAKKKTKKNPAAEGDASLPKAVSKCA